MQLSAVGCECLYSPHPPHSFHSTHQVCTDTDLILSIDLRTVTIDALTFSSPFTLTATRDDYGDSSTHYCACRYSLITTDHVLRLFSGSTHYRRLYTHHSPLAIHDSLPTTH